MKILYVKNNSERNPKFQLKTIIYEEKNQKFIKKQALTPEAIPHLKKMKETYTKLKKSIINPKIKPAKIVDEDANSLTFEFIQGESLEKKLSDASLINKIEEEKILDEYITLINTSFKTDRYDIETLKSDTHKELFGDIDYSLLTNEYHFSDISNIDLILSNIIYSKDTIYLIDYEWAYDVAVPLNYILHRTFSMLANISKDEKYHFPNALLYHKMERHFVDKYVMQNGFYFNKHQYIKTNADITSHLQGKENHIQELKQHVIGKETHIQEISTLLHSSGEDLSYARSIVQLRDDQINFLMYMIETLKLKILVKDKIKKYIPTKLLKIFGYKKNILPSMANFPMKTSKQINPYEYIYEDLKYTEDISQEIKNFMKKPLISIIMPVYNVDPKWLKLAIKSIENQWYKNWELCIADDKSTNQNTINYLQEINNHPKIKITFLNKNLNISGASNEALNLASGEYIALVDNDDEITPNALYEMVQAINKSDPDFIYSDEDFISMDQKYINPHFKPDFSPDLLLSHNYITHLTCFKKELLDSVEKFNSQFDGSQDYDLFLRLTEKTEKIHHIQKVLYHWRMLETSTSANSEAKPEAIERGRKVLEATLKRRNINATVTHASLHHYFRVKYAIKNTPLVSIIIPFNDKPELLDMCLNSILDKSTYQNYEIIGISNNSKEKQTFDMMMTLEEKDSRVSFYEYNTEFNYSDINNHAVNTYAKGEHIILLNNDIEVISTDWIEAMLEHSQRENVGCVGAKLYYPDDTVQHAGIIIGLGGYAGHSHKMYPRDNPGYFNRLNSIQNLSAVTAACLMIKKSLYTRVDGLDAKSFKVAYNDVDFCLRVKEKGYLNIYTPYAEMYHHESISRGYETTPDKIARFQTEKDALHHRHQIILENGDPYYNPGLTHDKEDFSLCSNN